MSEWPALALVIVTSFSAGVAISLAADFIDVRRWRAKRKKKSERIDSDMPPKIADYES